MSVFYRLLAFDVVPYVSLVNKEFVQTNQRSEHYCVGIVRKLVRNSGLSTKTHRQLYATNRRIARQIYQVLRSGGMMNAENQAWKRIYQINKRQVSTEEWNRFQVSRKTKRSIHKWHSKQSGKIRKRSVRCSNRWRKTNGTEKINEMESGVSEV